jgi:hypothetical protein
MDPQIPIEPLVPGSPPGAAPPPDATPPTISATSATLGSPLRLTGIRRSVATLGLAVGLLTVSGAAVVLAASPEPSESASPGTTPSTQPSTNDDSTSTDRPDKGDCPEDGAGAQDDTDGQSPAASPSTDTSTST